MKHLEEAGNSTPSLHVKKQPKTAVFGQRPRQGTKSCRMGRNSVHPSVRLFVPPVASPKTPWQALRPLWLALKPHRLALRPLWLALTPY